MHAPDGVECSKVRNVCALLALEEGKETERNQRTGQDVRGEIAVMVRIRTSMTGGCVNGNVLSDLEDGIIWLIP